MHLVLCGVGSLLAVLRRTVVVSRRQSPIGDRQSPTNKKSTEVAVESTDPLQSFTTPLIYLVISDHRVLMNTKFIDSNI